MSLKFEYSAYPVLWDTLWTLKRLGLINPTGIAYPVYELTDDLYGIWKDYVVEP